MDFQEINALIQVRNYVNEIYNTMRVPVSEQQLKVIGGMRLLIERKLVELITSDDFKDYVGYENIKEVIREVANQNNIKATLNK